MTDLGWLPFRFAQSKKPLYELGFQISQLGLLLCSGSRSSLREQGFQPLERTNELGFQLFVAQCNSPKLSPSCSISENELNQNLSVIWLKFTHVGFRLNATGTPKWGWKVCFKGVSEFWFLGDVQLSDQSPPFQGGFRGIDPLCNWQEDPPTPLKRGLRKSCTSPFLVFFKNKANDRMRVWD